MFVSQEKQLLVIHQVSKLTRHVDFGLPSVAILPCLCRKRRKAIYALIHSSCGSLFDVSNREISRLEYKFLQQCHLYSPHINATFFEGGGEADTLLRLSYDGVQRQTAVTAYFLSKQLLLFAFAW